MKNIVTIIALLLAVTVNAQDDLKLCLSEAIKRSLSNNKTIQAEKLNGHLNEYRSLMAIKPIVAKHSPNDCHGN